MPATQPSRFLILSACRCGQFFNKVLFSRTRRQVFVHQRVHQTLVVRMALVAEHGVAAQDAVLEGVEADDFLGLGIEVGNFGSFVSGGRVHLRFLEVWMWGVP